MTEERLEEALKELRGTYNRPPETPRDEIWAEVRRTLPGGEGVAVSSIEDGRERRRRWRSKVPGAQWAGLAIAAAALLVIGIGIGRVSVESGSGPETAASTEASTEAGVSGETEPGAGRESAFRYAAVEHLLRSESLLTMVRTDARAGRYDAAVGEWARDLLVRTRLLLDSPARQDPAMGELLEDLELILVQLTKLGENTSNARRGQEELDLITRGMEEQEMLLRIQAVVPAGAGLVGA